MSYTCVDAFAGAGGMSLGLQSAGYDVVLSFDIDARCVESQQLNASRFPHPVCQQGIEDMLDGSLLSATGLNRGELFLLAGGPPCQGFSVQRIGAKEDDRNNLVSMYMKLVEEVLPQYFIMENVPGITGERGKLILKEVLGRIAAAGYWIHQQPLNAQDFGAPQRRKRIFIVGERADGNMPRFTFPQPTTPKRRVTVREAIGHLPTPPIDGTDHPDIVHHRRDRLSPTNLQRMAVLKPGQSRQHLPDTLLADCHRRDASVIGHRNVYGRMNWDDVAPTITARFDSFTRGLFGHPEEPRSVTLREGALLQTFPEDFIFAGNKVDIARQIGNAVPPLLAEAIGRQILHCHQLKTEDLQR